MKAETATRITEKLHAGDKNVFCSNGGRLSNGVIAPLTYLLPCRCLMIARRREETNRFTRLVYRSEFAGIELICMGIVPSVLSLHRLFSVLSHIKSSSLCI